MNLWRQHRSGKADGHLTRSVRHRCLQRHGIPRLPDVGGDKAKRQKVKRYPIGFFKSTSPRHDPMLAFLDYASVFVFAHSGALVASRARLDIAGLAFVESITARRGRHGARSAFKPQSDLLAGGYRSTNRDDRGVEGINDVGAHTSAKARSTPSPPRPRPENRRQCR
jgi:hypothetical protein